MRYFILVSVIYLIACLPLKQNRVMVIHQYTRCACEPPTMGDEHATVLELYNDSTFYLVGSLQYCCSDEIPSVIIALKGTYESSSDSLLLKANFRQNTYFANTDNKYEGMPNINRWDALKEFAEIDYQNGKAILRKKSDTSYILSTKSGGELSKTPYSTQSIELVEVDYLPKPFLNKRQTYDTSFYRIVTDKCRTNWYNTRIKKR